MYRNYYLFKRQVDYLNTVLGQATIRQCFTHRKDELVLALHRSDQDDFLLRINLQIQLPYLLLYPLQNIKDPRIDFFPEIIGTAIEHFEIVPFDKLVRIQVTGFKLKLCFFGQRPNIFLLDRNNIIIGTFKKNVPGEDDKKHGRLIDPAAMDRDKLVELVDRNGDYNLLDFLNHHLGGFNSLLSRELCFRCGLPADKKIHTLTGTEQEALQSHGRAMTGEMGNQPARIYQQPESVYLLSLLPLHHLDPGIKSRPFDDVNIAWKQFISHHHHQIRFIRLAGRIKEVIRNRLAYVRRSLQAMEQEQDLEKRKKEAELIGNLLLTNAAKIPRGSRIVELENIFSATPELIRIKLNPAKSIPENARKYFEKYKDLEQKKTSLSVRRDTYQKELTYWQDLSAKTEQLSSVEKLEKIEKELIERGSLQSEKLSSGEGESLGYSFRRLLLGKKWEVFIGKNAHNNDLLTFKFANKFDLWFHAQGCSGSHVVLRLGSKNSMPPPEILEQAAQVAAHFSSAKHSTLVPVNYTQVRFVHKARNSPPGTVTIRNEKTVLVKPQKFL